VEQDATPYLDALIAYADRDPGRFHVPGHKGGRGADPALRAAIGEAALRLDIPAGIEGIDVGPDPANTPFQLAQRLAAEAWGARRSWFLVNGASGGNQAICLALAHRGDRVVVQRNVHTSVIDGLILSGMRPAFVAPELDPELGIAHCLTPDSLDEALAAEPDAVAAMVVSPTYFGAVADVAALAEVAHARGVPLVADEAWGAHLRFSSALPTSALECGADVVLSSTHKIAGSITQSAILHVGECGERIDDRIVDRAVTLVESTSPNALLTASLDATRRQAATRGEELLAETVASLAELRERIRSVPGLDVLDERIVGRAGVHAYDPTRLVVDVRGLGATGHRVARLMREQDDINLELFSENVVVAVFGIGERAAKTGERLVEALEHASQRIGEEGEEPLPPFAEPPPWGPTELSPREAFLAGQEVVAFDEAEGRVAAESLAAYPPGVPNVLPGERLTRPTLDYIADSVAHGGLVRGASDRTLQTVRVVVR
jgi:lysine decarboxylase